MSTDHVLLAVLMAAVTYPARAVGLVVPGIRRLPPVLLSYLRLVGPAVLASLAAVTLVLGTRDDGRPFLYVGPEWIAVALCVAIVAWRKNLLMGLVLAAALMAILRATGLAPA